jgi:hypothetical protein
LSHQRGKIPNQTKPNKKKKNTIKCPKFKCNTVSVSFSACRCSSVVVSSKEGRKKKRVWRQFCEWLSEAAAHLPAAVSLLLLEAFFMQISGVSLSLTWLHRLCLLRVLLGATATAISFPLPKHTGGGDTAPALLGQHVYLQFMWEVGLAPLSCEVFLPLLLLQAFLLLVAGRVPPLLPSLAGLFIYSSMRDCSCPPSGSGSSALFAACLFCCYCLLFIFFSFFPGWGSVCPGGCADLAQGCLWEYRVPLSSPCGPCLPKWSGRWHLAAWEPSWFLHLT